MPSIRACPLPQAAVRARWPRLAHAHAHASLPPRHFSSSRRCFEQQFHRKESFRSRLNSALKSTKIKWEPIPVALGIGFLGAWQLYKVQKREKHTQRDTGDDTEMVIDEHGKPRKRERIRPSGPW
jgi:phosphatidylserine decarboxylase